MSRPHRHELAAPAENKTGGKTVAAKAGTPAVRDGSHHYFDRNRRRDVIDNGGRAREGHRLVIGKASHWAYRGSGGNRTARHG